MKPTKPRPLKKLFWVGNSDEDLKNFPVEARKTAGRLLNQIQRGEEIDPKSLGAMPEVGAGVYEIKIRGGMAYRVFYVAKFAEGIYILHCFNKKSKSGIATPKEEIAKGQQRYKELIEDRRQNQ